MEHEQLKENLSAYIDDELPPSERAEAEAHLKSCPVCAKELEALKRASAAYHDHAASTAPEGLADSVLEQGGSTLRPRLALAAALFIFTLLCYSSVKVFGPQISHVMSSIMAVVSPSSPANK